MTKHYCGRCRVEMPPSKRDASIVLGVEKGTARIMRRRVYLCDPCMITLGKLNESFINSTTNVSIDNKEVAREVETAEAR